MTGPGCFLNWSHLPAVSLTVTYTDSAATQEI